MRLLISFLAVDLIAASNYQAWSRMLDGPQGGHGDTERFIVWLLLALAAIATVAVAIRRRKAIPQVAGIAVAVPFAMFALSWGLGLVATHLLRPHYCAEIKSPGQCARCFSGEEQRLRCGG